MDEMISRQAVLKLLSAMPPEEAMTKAMLIQSVKQLPSAQPERKRGKWQEDPSGYGFWICSNCGFVSEASAANVLYNFCPNCGADMREVDDERPD